MIDLEHTSTLGQTLTEIAYEKGGIFKKDCPAVALSQTEEVETELRNCAKEKGLFCVAFFDFRMSD